MYFQCMYKKGLHIAEIYDPASGPICEIHTGEREKDCVKTTFSHRVLRCQVVHSQRADLHTFHSGTFEHVT